MRLAIVGTVLASALMVTGAAAQGKAEISGTAGFCIQDGLKADCTHASMEACQKALKTSAKEPAKPTCVARTSVK